MLRTGETVVHHRELYMSRGEVVILSSPSEDNQRTAFKIPLYFLQKSPVFQAMIDLATDSDNPVIYDGAPVIAVDDSQEDLRVLFTSLYGKTYVI